MFIRHYIDKNQCLLVKTSEILEYLYDKSVYI